MTLETESQSCIGKKRTRQGVLESHHKEMQQEWQICSRTTRTWEREHDVEKVSSQSDSLDDEYLQWSETSSEVWEQTARGDPLMTKDWTFFQQKDDQTPTQTQG